MSRALPALGVSSPRQRQRGVALITAVLIVALAVVLTASLFLSQEVQTRRTGNLQHHDQALHYALGAEDWARSILARDAGGSQVDHLGEAWATLLPPTLIEHGQMEGHIEDMQGRLNLNGPLGDNDGLPGYKVLMANVLQHAGLDPNLIGALRDWADPDGEVDLQGGAEDWDYLDLSPPYRVANAPFAGVEELALVRGVDPEGFRAAASVLTALPDATAINVNTMVPALLPLMFPELTEADVERILEERKAHPFERTDAFLERITGPVEPTQGRKQPGAPGVAADNTLRPRLPLSVGSNYFMLSVTVSLGQGRLQLRSLLHREAGRVKVVRRWFAEE